MAVDYDQFKGKPFQVISKLGVRYTGVFDHINQEDQTICLAQVYNHGTEDRPTARKLPGSTKSLGWVRFRTESIESLSLVENYVHPGVEPEPQEDPILASVSQAPPPNAVTAGPSSPQTTSQPYQRHDLPAKPSQSAISAATAMSRVEHSLSELSVDDRPRRPSRQPQARPPAVPDTEFDFQKANEKFAKEKEALKSTNGQGVVVTDLDEPVNQPHPSAIVSPSEGEPKNAVYNKSSFFDSLSHSSSKVSRNEERHRNLDTFGETGGSGMGGRGGYGGRGRGRGGYNTGGGHYNGNGYGGGRGRGGYRRGGSQTQSQPGESW
ncbi:hypothetical protein CNBG_5709 [Cryptococcus deuterogattii R265]|uniref:DFDF domain-containing protein n=1 Tax=Cryptococcus deuterogattii (strain R265) TaxID=294750 RepID=A0A095DGN1_CRYD2|nr:hypothetical protein CNBG_5709 [Cryptococcus deuterogattii R265]KIR26155.1 hypothetical protein I309_04968 [Cryptococcus deuterogattii LA55]KIR31367.1 hypothetical protein I352_06258 [Cryptococcus deuterogattii MMRL2647]KIR72523.1 hypothetical protein I310_03933 [Cryptococcus deuterogattii CA1014]KIR92118.1 hypothetical protein I304_04288 [Cryptococcus deuterogattii CBS 10090]KIR96098.1 hypothetical protein L804_06591 [Cryptococcus deuterogattii 2001/935-1]